MVLSRVLCWLLEILATDFSLESVSFLFRFRKVSSCHSLKLSLVSCEFCLAESIFKSFADSLSHWYGSVDFF